MAITNSRKIGRTRIKLAEILEREMEEKLGMRVTVDPSDLMSQNPYWSSPQGGCCSWYGYGQWIMKDFTSDIHFCSWTPMGQCVKHGITIIPGGECGYAPSSYEIDEAESAK